MSILYLRALNTNLEWVKSNSYPCFKALIKTHTKSKSNYSFGTDLFKVVTYLQKILDTQLIIEKKM